MFQVSYFISKSSKIQIEILGGQAIEIMGKNGDPTSITLPQVMQHKRYELKLEIFY